MLAIIQRAIFLIHSIISLIACSLDCGFLWLVSLQCRILQLFI
ncbi:hypothetical protein [Vibrio gallaecicus]|nr:hypothetical protein [Vibrio gallaecicus]MDN3615825.1 hypothetical protein [Vibrio gallaecicus]